MALSPEDVYICDVVKFELYYGAYSSSRTTENLANLSKFFGDFISLPFNGEAAAICGRVRAQLKAIGTPIGAYDLQIAARGSADLRFALAHNLTLVTHNTREFSRVTGLAIVDWEAEIS